MTCVFSFPLSHTHTMLYTEIYMFFKKKPRHIRRREGSEPADSKRRGKRRKKIKEKKWHFAFGIELAHHTNPRCFLAASTSPAPKKILRSGFAVQGRQPRYPIRFLLFQLTARATQEHEATIDPWNILTWPSRLLSFNRISTFVCEEAEPQ